MKQTMRFKDITIEDLKVGEVDLSFEGSLAEVIGCYDLFKTAVKDTPELMKDLIIKCKDLVDTFAELGVDIFDTNESKHYILKDEYDELEKKYNELLNSRDKDWGVDEESIIKDNARKDEAFNISEGDVPFVKEGKTFKFPDVDDEADYYMPSTTNFESLNGDDN